MKIKKVPFFCKKGTLSGIFGTSRRECVIRMLRESTSQRFFEAARCGFPPFCEELQRGGKFTFFLFFYLLLCFGFFL